jgi:hypothetical protein
LGLADVEGVLCAAVSASIEEEMMIEIPHALSITPVGSRVTCNPAPTDTDRDWLVLVDKVNESALWDYLSTNQWEIGGSLPDDMNNTPADDVFMSFTKGVENITTTSTSFHRRFLAATSIAKRLNLMDKADRIALFQAVLYANADVPTITAPDGYFA